MENLIKNFEQFTSGLNIYEGDGFGTSDFLMKKMGDVYHYFFKLEDIEGVTKGFHLMMGKYSNLEEIEGAKNSYCVLGINQIPEENIDDLAADKGEIPEPNNIRFRMRGNSVMRLMDYVSKCIINYLELNSKVVRIYDEMQENLIVKGKGEYLEFMKSIVLSYLGERWNVQEGSSKKSILINR